MKIIIYGIGKVFEQYQKYIKWEWVSDVVDGNLDKQGRIIHDFIVKAPKTITENTTDFILIFTNDFFDQIREYLIGELFILEDRILSYNALISDRWFWSNELRQLLNQIVTNSAGIVNTNYCYIERLYLDNMDRIVEYDVNAVNDYSDIILWNDYDDNFMLPNNKLSEYSRIIWIIPHGMKFSKKYKKKFDFIAESRKKKIYIFLHEIVYIFEKQEKEDSIDFQMYTICHKKYNCVKSEAYRTIAVGEEKNFDYDFEDSEGKNIAVLNPYINECTALYWIWKNVKHKYVGTSHYRRYFYKSDIKQRSNVIDNGTVETIFNNGYDMILPEITRMDISMLDNIRMSVGENICNKVLPIVKNVLQKRAPEYMDIFENVIMGNTMFRCNMFIMRWKEFDNYCSWLFSFLREIAESIDYSGMEYQERRVVGYFAEIMLTVWVKKQKLIIKEMPITDI